MTLCLCGSGSSCSDSSVAGHHTCLSTNCNQNAPIAEHEQQEHENVKEEEVEDAEYCLGHLAAVERESVTRAVYNGACRKRHAQIILTVQSAYVPLVSALIRNAKSAQDYRIQYTIPTIINYVCVFVINVIAVKSTASCPAALIRNACTLLLPRLSNSVYIYTVPSSNHHQLCLCFRDKCN